MVSTILTDVTKPYSAVESWTYDRLIAPAVAGFFDILEDEFVTPLPSHARVLDVGCGGGQILERLAEIRPDLHLRGIDLSNDQVARANKRLHRFGPRVEVQQGDALNLPFKNGFDAVFSIASLKHWPIQRRGLEQCYQALKPGGRLLLVEADRGCRVEDVEAFVSGWRTPQLLQTLMMPLASIVFRTFVAGHSVDLDEARQLVSALELKDKRIERVTDTPALMISGYKP